jgi:hypothetical protein
MRTTPAGVNSLGQELTPQQKQRRLESAASDGHVFLQSMNRVVSCRVMLKTVMP